MSEMLQTISEQGRLEAVDKDKAFHEAVADVVNYCEGDEELQERVKKRFDMTEFKKNFSNRYRRGVLCRFVLSEFKNIV